MPKPVFILLAKSCTQDRDSNALSVSEVVESFEFSPVLPSEQTLIVWEPLRLIAVWRGEESDGYGPDGKSDEFEFESIAHVPGAGSMVVSSGTFRFEKDRPVQRIIVAFLSPIPMKDSGLFRLESRIRTGGNDWISQDYAVLVKKVEAAITHPSE